MSRSAIANVCAIPAALFLLVIGAIHGWVNVRDVQRAVGRGDMAARLGTAMSLNAAFSGVAIGLLGLIVLLFLPGLRAGSRYARYVAATIGTCVSVLGAAGYLSRPTSPGVLIFFFFGALLAAPLFIWSREFPNA